MCFNPKTKRVRKRGLKKSGRTAPSAENILRRAGRGQGGAVGAWRVPSLDQRLLFLTMGRGKRRGPQHHNGASSSARATNSEPKSQAPKKPTGLLAYEEEMKHIEAFLALKGLVKLDIPKDGSCLVRLRALALNSPSVALPLSLDGPLWIFLSII